MKLSRTEFDFITSNLSPEGGGKYKLDCTPDLTLLEHCRAKELIEKDSYKLTEACKSLLEKYKVRNAIILAAGLSSRFVPFSFEKPKGLISVRGEILVERQIKQLKDAGINDITLIVGYKKEHFFYLENKFNVKILVNEEYAQFNNPSSLNLCLDEISNTYICSSDNYFLENPFSKYEYQPYYSAEFSEGETNEYCMGLSGDLITSVHPEGGRDAWFMIGHVYFDSAISEKFKEIFRKEYLSLEMRKSLWEDIYAKHVEEIKLHIKKYHKNIFEFDSYEELREFDPLFLEFSDSKIIRNISRTLNCLPGDIRDIKKIKEGMTNNSFSFSVGENRYVYRHPGVDTEKYINRYSESKAMEYAHKLALDNTFIFMDENEGWKISRFLPNCRELSYGNSDDVSMAIALLRRLHNAHIEFRYEKFDVWNKTLEFISVLKKESKIEFEGFNELFELMGSIAKFVSGQERPLCLCHCDSYSPNFLVHHGGMELVDWEYSGASDPALDIGIFICCSESYTFEDADRVIELYLQRKPDQDELRFYYAYISLASYYWYVWALYQESLGKSVGSYLLLWFNNSVNYGKKVLSSKNYN